MFLFQYDICNSWFFPIPQCVEIFLISRHARHFPDPTDYIFCFLFVKLSKTAIHKDMLKQMGLIHRQLSLSLFGKG